MRVNHCRPDIAMPPVIPESSDVISCPGAGGWQNCDEKYGRCTLGILACRPACLIACAHAFRQMIATIFSCVAIEGQLLAGEKPLPDKLPASIFLYFAPGHYQEYNRHTRDSSRSDAALSMIKMSPEFRKNGLSRGTVRSFVPCVVNG